MAKKIHQIHIAFEHKVKELKPFLFDQACEFIREKTQEVTKLLTRQHHSFLNQFLAFKDRTDSKLAWADRMVTDVSHLETMIAMKTPVMEAEHILEEKNKFKFYDCLIPMLKEHRRFKLLPDAQFSLADFKT